MIKNLSHKLPQVNSSAALQLLGLAILVFFIASYLKPSRYYESNPGKFDQIIPSILGKWIEVDNSTPQVSVVSDERSLINQLYDDTLMRAYADSEGRQIMVALAYAKEQRQDVKIHQPEVCYPAQGYPMLKSETVVFDQLHARDQIVGKRQLYSGQNHKEAVSYWIRVGDETMTSGLQMRFKIIKDGLFKRRLDDGILVRVSSIISDETKLAEAYKMHDDFLKELTTNVALTQPKLLVP